MEQLREYQTFQDKRHSRNSKPPDGHKKIKVHLIYAITHDGHHKAQCVADGYLTDVPIESVYYGSDIQQTVYRSSKVCSAVHVYGHAFTSRVTRVDVKYLYGPSVYSTLVLYYA